MATDRPDWVPEGWEWEWSVAKRKTADGPHIAIYSIFGKWGVGGTNVLSLKTALAIAELLAAERGGWA